MTIFTHFELTGTDAEKFLQGQITANMQKITDQYQATAISNLKGRVEFGLWLNKTVDGFSIVLANELADSFAKHVKKYGAFSKISLSEAQPIFAVVENGEPTFSFTATADDPNWQTLSIAQGNYWITQAAQGLFQPQELRLHQRGGVDYDKGCYLGQEIIARLWFKASPKAWLHRVAYQHEGDLTDKIQVVNQIQTDNGFEALVVARPEEIQQANLTVLALPDALQQPVARV
ncbi:MULTISPECIES: folate-binding Fe/S cluster repair protein [unclassified Moraxella]|uniref:CAF17-like 4Fe-4S cluster assembly/insertion protein YgfZ n=1 Tax=unclassified Moraxella TaxID=2685852 RepID=UPI003AF5B78A